MDGGVQRNNHVLKALSLGAKGRRPETPMFPLARGRAARSNALDLMREELVRDMKLMGCTSGRPAAPAATCGSGRPAAAKSGLSCGRGCDRRPAATPGPAPAASASIALAATVSAKSGAVRPAAPPAPPAVRRIEFTTAQRALDACGLGRQGQRADLPGAGLQRMDATLHDFQVLRADALLDRLEGLADAAGRTAAADAAGSLDSIRRPPWGAWP